MKHRRIAKRPAAGKAMHPLYPVVRAAVIGENLPTVGGNDAKYFEAVDVIPFDIPASDLPTISKALCEQPGEGIDRARMNLSLRFPHMRTDRVKRTERTRMEEMRKAGA